MKSQAFTIKVLVLIILIVYLFVSAEPPLPDSSQSGRMVSIDLVFKALESENDTVRKLYTKEIVGAGLKNGLAFEEEWRKEEVEAGPLPALFLRETAAYLEKSPARLSLFLGSDFPINASNQFDGIQVTKFQEIKDTLEARFFYEEDTDRFTAMFPDNAVAEACVTCHNDHAQSPKTDWKLNEVMGATTWSHPSEEVSVEEFTSLIKTLRNGFSATYATYLEKTKTFANPPVIGDRWPREGNFLPSLDVFMDEFTRKTSTKTLGMLLQADEGTHEAE